MKPNQSSARDDSSGDRDQPDAADDGLASATDDHGQASQREPTEANEAASIAGNQAIEDEATLPMPPAPLAPSQPGATQSSVRGAPAPPIPPPPVGAPPAGSPPPAAPPATPVGSPLPTPPPGAPVGTSPPSGHSPKRGWRAALIAINVAAIVMTAIAVTLLLTDEEKASPTPPTSVPISTTSSAPTSTDPAPTSTPAPVTTVPVPPVPVPVPAPTAPVPGPTSPVPAPTTPAPTEPPAVLPSAEEARSTAQSTIEGFLSADSDNRVEDALGYLMAPLDTWVDKSDRSLEQVREDIDGGKSDNTQLSMIGGVTLTSGPESSDLGAWEATVTYDLRATGSFYSDKYQETRCIDNVQRMEDRIVGTSDGGGRIKGHRRIEELSNDCTY